MLTIFQKTASLLKFSPKFLLIAIIIFSTVILLQAQTLEAFNPNANVAVDDIDLLASTRRRREASHVLSGDRAQLGQAPSGFRPASLESQTA